MHYLLFHVHWHHHTLVKVDTQTSGLTEGVQYLFETLDALQFSTQHQESVVSVLEYCTRRAIHGRVPDHLFALDQALKYIRDQQEQVR
jgi:hypothetical protein